MSFFNLENRVGAFPEESWKIARDDMEIANKNVKYKTRFSWAYAIMYTYADSSYGFRNCLRTGNFAPYEHERVKDSISGYNCTTVIPAMFTHAHIAGLEPRIVQFIDFTNIDPKESKEEREMMESHFALIVNAGRRHEYLMDPFHSIFGPILKDDGKQMRIGKVGKYRAVRRTYRQVIPYTPSEFDTLMKRMHEPAASLEMLEAGQKVWQNREVLNVSGPLMIYYDHNTNTITTRFTIPQVGIRKKIICCHQKLDQNGDVLEREIELFNAKRSYWKSLGEGRRIGGSFSFGYFDGLQLRIREQVERRHRIGPAALLNPEFKRTIEAYSEPAFDALSPSEQKEIRKMLLVRALYETEKPEQQYVFTEEDRNRYLKRKLAAIWKKSDERRPISHKTYKHTVKLEKLPPALIRALRKEEHRMDKEISEEDEKFVALLNLRNRCKPGFFRTMDKILYADEVENETAEALEKRLNRRGANILIGYAATVADFVPYVRNARDDLTQRDVMHVIREKIRAKHTHSEIAIPV